MMIKIIFDWVRLKRKIRKAQSWNFIMFAFLKKKKIDTIEIKKKPEEQKGRRWDWSICVTQLDLILFKDKINQNN